MTGNCCPPCPARALEAASRHPGPSRKWAYPLSGSRCVSDSRSDRRRRLDLPGDSDFRACLDLSPGGHRFFDGRRRDVPLAADLAQQDPRSGPRGWPPPGPGPHDDHGPVAHVLRRRHAFQNSRSCPSFQINGSYPPYRGSSYLGTDPDQSHDDEFGEPIGKVYDLTPKSFVSHAGSLVSTNGGSNGHSTNGIALNGHAQNGHSVNRDSGETLPEIAHAPAESDEVEVPAAQLSEQEAKALRRKQPLVNRPASRPAPRQSAPAPASKSAAKPSAPRPRTAGPVNPRDQRNRTVASSDGRPGASANGSRHRAPAPRTASGNGNGAGNGVRHASGASKMGPATARSRSFANGNSNRSAASKTQWQRRSDR